jgi:hypothetical protein
MERMNAEFVHVQKDFMDENVNVIQHHQRWNQKFNNAKSKKNKKKYSFDFGFVSFRPGSSDICSGRGQCVCGRCKCETATIEVRNRIVERSIFIVYSAGSTYLW